MLINCLLVCSLMLTHAPRQPQPLTHRPQHEGEANSLDLGVPKLKEDNADDSEHVAKQKTGTVLLIWFACELGGCEG